jgi:hypothetical protein
MLVIHLLLHTLLWWFAGSFGLGFAWIGACLAGWRLARVFPTLGQAPMARAGLRGG